MLVLQDDPVYADREGRIFGNPGSGLVQIRNAIFFSDAAPGDLVKIRFNPWLVTQPEEKDNMSDARDVIIRHLIGYRAVRVALVEAGETVMAERARVRIETLEVVLSDLDKENLKETEGLYLIRKGGYYYRPNCAGYTANVEDAGRYTKAEAEREAAIEPWNMAAIPLSSVIDPRVAAVKEATAKVVYGGLYADGRWDRLPHVLTVAFDVLHTIAHDGKSLRNVSPATEE